MSQANVKSLDAMRTFRVHLIEFSTVAMDVAVTWFDNLGKTGAGEILVIAG